MILRIFGGGGRDLTSSQTVKLDQSLDEALANASSDEELRLIFFLKRDARRGPGNPDMAGPKPMTRAEFRTRAINADNSLLGSSAAHAIDALKKIGLTVRGTGSVGALVVDGTASQLRRGIALDCIKSAMLDQPMYLDRPVRPSN